jgi:myo-inositol-1(or 4)-monophosphatase
MSYDEINQTLQTVVKEAGQFMLGSRETESTDKTNAKDFVTVADIKSQNIIEERLKKKYPDILVLSEEHDEAERRKLFAPDFTGFVMDPIDGTYNFKRDMRESAVSVGFVENGQPKTGAIYDPYKDELYAATVGKGATRNGQTIHVSNQADIIGASITTSNSYDDAAMARNLKRHMAIYEQTGHMPWTNCPGSGVLILTYIACGRQDIYHHNGLKPWDNAAAFLLIREAGGKVLTLKGEEAPFTSATVLAGPPELVAKLQEVFSKIDQTLLD